MQMNIEDFDLSSVRSHKSMYSLIDFVYLLEFVIKDAKYLSDCKELAKSYPRAIQRGHMQEILDVQVTVQKIKERQHKKEQQRLEREKKELEHLSKFFAINTRKGWITPINNAFSQYKKVPSFLTPSQIIKVPEFKQDKRLMSTLDGLHDDMLQIRSLAELKVQGEKWL